MKDQNKDCSLIILLGEVTSEKERNKGVKSSHPHLIVEVFLCQRKQLFLIKYINEQEFDFEKEKVKKVIRIEVQMETYVLLPLGSSHHHRHQTRYSTRQSWRHQSEIHIIITYS